MKIKYDEVVTGVDKNESGLFRAFVGGTCYGLYFMANEAHDRVAEIVNARIMAKGKKGKMLITLAETADEALSDFIGYKEIEPSTVIDEGSVCKLDEVAGELDRVELQNIISFDEELPDDMDGWYAVRCA